MKGNKKFLILAVLVLLITVSFATYAIYKTSETTNASVSAAAWSIALKDGATTLTSSDTITFTAENCSGTANGHVEPGKVAPGLTCTKTLTLDATGTEVDVAYTVTAGTPQFNNANVSSDAGLTATLTGNTSGTMAYNAEDKDEVLTLTVTWTGTDDTDKNAADIGLAGGTITVPVTVNASQSFGS